MQWFMENYVELLIAIGAIIGGLETLARFTPTKKDDTALERIGSVLRKVFDLLGIPNIKKK